MKFNVTFGYYDSIEVETDNNYAGTALGLAIVEKLNKDEKGNLYTHEEVCEMMKDENVDFTDCEVFDQFIGKNNFYCVDVSEYDIPKGISWIWYVNMDWVTIREVE